MTRSVESNTSVLLIAKNAAAITHVANSIGQHIQHNTSAIDQHHRIEPALKEFRPEVSVLDHDSLQEKTWLKIRQIHATDPDMPIIILSSFPGQDIAVNMLKAGANDYILKDNLERLQQAIDVEIFAANNRRKKRKTQAALQHLALHDSLTGLVNRNEFERRADRALNSAKYRGLTHCLMYLDLDQFKIVNDTCGHMAGDALLRSLAEILQKKVRERDTLARLGGDEFGILLENCPLDRGQKIAETLRNAIHSFKFYWESHIFSVGLSIGITPIDQTTDSVNEVIGIADEACYKAKKQGRNKVYTCTSEHKQSITDTTKTSWLNQINHALDNDGFELYQHSVVSLSNSTHLPYQEFLLRLNDKQGNVISPCRFLPTAERHDLMPAIDRWVIQHAFEHIIEAAPSEATKTIFINLSAMTLNNEKNHQLIRDYLKQLTIKQDNVCFDITEISAIADLKNAQEFIKSIKSDGCKIALDNFGSGTGSFSYLKEFPLDYVKINSQYIRNMMKNKMDYAIVESINRISHVADIQTIAEYVENTHIQQHLTKLGVDYGQGFSLGMPKPLKEKQAFATI